MKKWNDLFWPAVILATCSTFLYLFNFIINVEGSNLYLFIAVGNFVAAILMGMLRLLDFQNYSSRCLTTFLTIYLSLILNLVVYEKLPFTVSKSTMMALQ